MRFVALLALFLFAVNGEETAIQQRGRKVVEAAVDALGGQKYLTMADRVETAHDGRAEVTRARAGQTLETSSRACRFMQR